MHGHPSGVTPPCHGTVIFPWYDERVGQFDITEQLQRYSENFLSQMDGIARSTFEAVEGFGKLAFEVATDAVEKGIGALASIIGLGGVASGLASTKGASVSLRSGATSEGWTPVRPNIPTRDPEPLVSNEVVIQRARDAVANMPESVQLAVADVQKSTAVYQLQDAGVDATPPPPTPAGQVRTQGAGVSYTG